MTVKDKMNAKRFSMGQLLALLIGFVVFCNMNYGIPLESFMTYLYIYVIFSTVLLTLGIPMGKIATLVGKAIEIGIDDKVDPDSKYKAIMPYLLTLSHLVGAVFEQMTKASKITKKIVPKLKNNIKEELPEKFE